MNIRGNILPLFAGLLVFLLFSSTALAEPGDEFYFEDFSATEEGLLPDGWKGGENMAVEPENGITVLKRFTPGKVDMMSETIPFPENFSIRLSLTHHMRGIIIGLDELSFKLYYNNIANVLKVYRGTEEGVTKTIDKKILQAQNRGLFSYPLTIEKKGPVVKVYINNDKIFVGRYKGINPTKIRFQSVEDDKPYFIEKIVAEEL